jgi:hypothetical protein
MRAIDQPPAPRHFLLWRRRWRHANAEAAPGSRGLHHRLDLAAHVRRAAQLGRQRIGGHYRLRPRDKSHGKTHNQPETHFFSPKDQAPSSPHPRRTLSRSTAEYWQFFAAATDDDEWLDDLQI